MQRQRGELVPIGEVVSGLDDVPALREATPQARRSFTVADQVEQLVTASEADPDRGFMARTMALCSLPRSNPGNRLQYKRVNGPYTLIMTATGNYKLPYGNLPRLLMAWISTEATTTQSRILVLGDSLSDFMRTLGVYSSSGGKYTRLRNQMRRLFNAHVRLNWTQDEYGEASVSSSVADSTGVLVELEAARRAHAVGEQDRIGREVLSRRSSGHPVPLELEHPEGAQAFFAGPRSLLVAHLPDVRASRSAAAHLEAVVQPVRSAIRPSRTTGLQSIISAETAYAS